MSIEREILSQLLARTIEADRPVPPLDPRTPHEIKYTLAKQREKAQEAADGWFTTPAFGHERTRARVVRRLIDRGLLIERGTGPSRRIKLTDAGRTAAEAMR